MAAGRGAPGVNPCDPAPIRFANAPCSWGILELADAKEPFAYEQVLEEIRATGFDGTELGPYGFLPTEPAKLKTALDERGLVLVGAFVDLPFGDEAALKEETPRALAIADLLATLRQEESDVKDRYPVVILADKNGTVPARVKHAGRIRAPHMLSEEAFKRYAQRVSDLSRRLREKSGLRVCFHPHAAGYVETPEEILFLMENSDPDLVGLCLDTGHVAFGGGDPAAMLRRFAARLVHVHFKDFSRAVLERGRREGWNYFELVEQGVFCELGQGDVDFDAVAAELGACHYRGWIVVEQDVLPGMGTPFESARRNRAFLEKLLLA